MGKRQLVRAVLVSVVRVVFVLVAGALARAVVRAVMMVVVVVGGGGGGGGGTGCGRDGGKG